jgi:hypothetical protein
MRKIRNLFINWPELPSYVARFGPCSDVLAEGGLAKGGGVRKVVTIKSRHARQGDRSGTHDQRLAVPE